MQIFADLARAARLLFRSPGYAMACIAVLALGIGANVAIFTVVYSVILSPLPYPDASRLVFVWERFPNMPDPPAGRIQVARTNYIEWKRQNTVFADMAAFREMKLEETGGDRPRQVSTGFAEGSLFRLLGEGARIGRLFSRDEEQKPRDQVAVLTDSFFESRFHRDTAAIGKSILLGGTSYTVIGVLPAESHLPATWQGQDQLKPDVWVPLSRLWKTEEDDSRRQLLVMALLKDGASLAQARTEMKGITDRLQKAYPKLDQGWLSSVYPVAVEDTSPSLHRALVVLLAAVGFLLLIACANLANLTLARNTLRAREVSIRLALGATRSRIVWQLVTESLIVSNGGAVVGLILAQWCTDLMLSFKPPDIKRPELIGINVAVFGFAALASLVTTLLFGLAPAVSVSRADLNSALRASGWGVSAARARSRQFLIVAEVALALMLLSGAGLMIRSFQALVKTGIGFQTSQLMTADVHLPQQRYADAAAQSRFFHQLLDRVKAIPGVRNASTVDNLPLHQVSLSNFYIAGRPDPPLNSLPIADHADISPGYFQVIGLRLQTGRLFTDEDVAVDEKGSDSVAIVNEEFARKFFPGENPLGQRLMGPDKKRSFQIVGVVSNYRPMGVENGFRPQIFWPSVAIPNATVVLRTQGSPQTFKNAVQSAVWSLDRDIPLDTVKPLEAYVDEWQGQRKFNTFLLACFAGLALVLAMMGIYGVLSNLVASRVREIGIRMAIGAAPAEIGRLVLRQSLGPLGIGMALGLAGTFALSRLMESLLFQVHARDPLTLALAAATILVVSPVALFIPLRRATRVDCTIALREE